MAAPGGALHLVPVAPAAAGRAVRRGRLRGDEADRQPLPVADLGQRHRVGVRRGGRHPHLDQRRLPVRVLHGRVDGDPAPGAGGCPRGARGGGPGGAVRGRPDDLTGAGATRTARRTPTTVAMTMPAAVTPSPTGSSSGSAPSAAGTGTGGRPSFFVC